MSAELNDAELESILLNGDHDAARAVSVDISRDAGLTEEEIAAILGEKAVKYNPAQPRDERGRWTSLGGSSLLTQDFDENGRPMAGIPLFDRLMHEEGVERVDADTLQFYHGTTKQAWEKIQTEGLVPGASPGADAWSERHSVINFMPLRIGDRAASAYVAIDFDHAINFATYAATIQKGDPLVLGVTLDRDDFVNVRVDEQGTQDWPLTLLRHVGTIPPSKIENLGSGMFGEDLGYRVEPLLDKSDTITIYLVIVCEPSAEKYSPNQPRHPKGSPEGGQFMSTGGSASSAPTSYTRDDLFGAGITVATQETVDAFNEFVGPKMTPKEFYEGMTGREYVYYRASVGEDVPGAKIHISNSGIGFNVLGDVTTLDEAGDQIVVGYWSRFLRFNNESVIHSSFEVYPEHQGKGLAKPIIGSQVATYQRLGLATVKVGAGLAEGGYAWLRFGFTPNADSWTRGLVPAIRDRIQWQRFSSYPEYKSFSPMALMGFSQLLSSPNPKAAWVIADSRYGKQLLRGTSWDGTLNMRDPETMERFNAYVGRAQRN